MSPTNLAALLVLLVSPLAARKSDVVSNGGGGAVDLSNLTDTIQSLFGDPTQALPSDLAATVPPLARTASAGDSVISAAVAAGEKLLNHKAAAAAEIPKKAVVLSSTATKADTLESMDDFLGVSPKAAQPLPAVAAINGTVVGAEADIKGEKETTKALVNKKAKEDADKKAAAEKATKEKERKAREMTENSAKAAEEVAAKKRVEKEAEMKAKEMAEKKEEAKRKATEEVAAKERRKKEAERKAKEMAKKKAKEEAKKKAAEEVAAKERMKKETERKAKEVAEEKAKEEAEKKAEKKAKEEADKKLKEATIRKAQEDAENKAKEKAKEKADEKKAREVAEQKAKETAQKANEEVENKSAEEKAKEEAEKKAKEVIQKKTKEEGDREVAKEATEKKNAPKSKEVAEKKTVFVPARKYKEIEKLQSVEKRAVAEKGEAAQQKAEPKTKSHVSLASFYSVQAVRPQRSSHLQMRLDISGDEMVSAEEQSRVFTMQRPQFSSGFTLFGVRPDAAAPPASPTEKLKKVALVKAAHHLRKQDYDGTALAAREDSLDSIAITDPWMDMEREDSAEVNRVKREDVTARLEAKVAEKPREATKEEKEARGGVHMSKGWAELEEEDEDIENTLQRTDDLRTYQKLSQMQDTSMQKLSKQMERADAMTIAPRMGLAHHDKLNLKIHDRWASLEKRDRQVEENVRRNPDLKMIQVQQHLARSHVF